MSKYKIKGKPFIIKGAKDVSDCITSSEVMQKAGLDFNVSKCPLVAQMPIDLSKIDETLDEVNNDECFIRNGKVFREVPNSFATYRTDINIPLGDVKSKYEIVQNISAFNFFDDAIGKDKAIWQTAGYFGKGERVFVSAKLPDNIRVKDDIIENYLVFSNSHDGTSGVNILFTPIRVVCQNTLNAAIKTADNFIRFRHTQSVNSNLLNASEILGISKQKTDFAEQMFNSLADFKLTDEEVMQYIAKSYLSENEITNILNIDKDGIKKVFYRNGMIIEDAKISTRKVNMLTQTMDYYISGFGQQEFRGTAYGAYNAITGYYSNIANMEDAKRMDSLLYGNASRVTTNSLSLMIA